MVLETLQVLAVETVAHGKADIACINDIIALRDDAIQQAFTVTHIGVEHIVHAKRGLQVAVQEPCRKVQAHFGMTLCLCIATEMRRRIQSIAAQFHIVFLDEHIREIKIRKVTPQ